MSTTLRQWLSDTIARRFVVAESLTIAVTLVLFGIFNQIAGSFSQESLDRSGLLARVEDLTRVIDAAPSPMRESLSMAASSPGIFIDWYSADSQAAGSLEGMRKAERPVSITKAFPNRVFVTAEPDAHTVIPAGLSNKSSKTLMPYILALKLTDGSWLVFTVVKRLWGLSQGYRWALHILFACIAIAVVSTLAARRFAKPVKQLADGVLQFGMNPMAAPMAETGPREIRQVVRTVNLMQAQIKKFVENRVMMVAAISHDLRTPLTRLRLRGEFVEDPEQQARLFRDVDEMQTMIDGALAFFRDDATAEEPTTFDLPQLLLTIVNDYTDQGIHVIYAAPVRGSYHGRPFAIRRAITNLIENAIKYAKDPEIELQCKADAFQILVQDRGGGLPTDALENVFQPYYRMDKSRNRTTGGVGLGLTVTQSIVHGHGGTISLSNREGGGLSACVVLPILSATQSQGGGIDHSQG
jgi:signal transduction histidine kinase